jgi:hypothetical protein
MNQSEQPHIPWVRIGAAMAACGIFIISYISINAAPQNTNIMVQNATAAMEATPETVANSNASTDTYTPATTAPATTAPATTAPATTVPQPTAPATTAPQPTTPATTVPQPTTPATTVPQPTAPATTAPQPTTPAVMSATEAQTAAVSDDECSTGVINELGGCEPVGVCDDSQYENCGTEEANLTPLQPADEPVTVTANAPERILDAHRHILNNYNSSSSQYTVIIDSAAQQLYVLNSAETLGSWAISTGKGGMSSVPESSGTPLGVHQISWTVRGQLNEILSGSGATGRISTPGGTAYMTTRAFALNGQESRNSNSGTRGIFLHGTNMDSQLGQAKSGGCIRISDDVIIMLDDVALKRDVYVNII